MMQVTFGSWLKQRRKELGMAQEELAERIGCSEIMLRKLESGERHPSAQVAQLLANFLRIPDDERVAFVAFARSGNAAPTFSSEAAPWRTAFLHKTNLPVSLTPLIGREEEFTAVYSQMLNAHTHLLTLTGAPGIGKTRLALQVASEMVKHFEDGVFFIDLAPISEPQLVLPTLGRAVGLADDGKGSIPIERLLMSHLRDKRMLLVMDNFEHLLDSAFHLVELMEGSPWVKMLATSREPLHIKGERRFPVPRLSLPVLEQPAILSELTRYSAVELFVERARMSEPDFTLSDENCEAVARICVRLDGLPLAIELAAGQVSFLSPQEIGERLTGRLQLLKARERHLPERQRSLRGAIDSSYNLLGERERTLFRRLGVFEGGFTLEAAGAICGDALDPSDRDLELSSSSAVIEALQALVDKSLLTQVQTAHGQRRLAMLETIHGYALDQMSENQETELVRRQHARYFLALSEQADAELQGTEQALWLQRLEVEHDNLRAALDWAATNGEWETGVRMAGALWRFWEVHGYDKEGRQRLEAAIALVRSAGNRSLDGAYARALVGAGTLAYKLGDNVPARAMLDESLDIYRTLDDKLGLAQALRSLAQVYRFSGELVVAHSLLDESLAICRSVESKAGIASTLYALGVVALEEGEYSLARQLLEESLVLRRAMGDRVYLAKTLTWLGELARSSGDFERARETYEEAYSLNVATGVDLLYLLHNMGHVAHSQGDYARATALFTESLVSSLKTGDKEATIACLAGLAAVASDEGQLGRASKLFGSIDTLIVTLGVHMDVADRLAYERNRARAQASCDPAS